MSYIFCTSKELVRELTFEDKKRIFYRTCELMKGMSRDDEDLVISIVLVVFGLSITESFHRYVFDLDLLRCWREITEITEDVRNRYLENPLNEDQMLLDEIQRRIWSEFLCYRGDQ
jgi:hypothetical protein